MPTARIAPPQAMINDGRLDSMHRSSMIQPNSVVRSQVIERLGGKSGHVDGPPPSPTILGATTTTSTVVAAVFLDDLDE